MGSVAYPLQKVPLNKRKWNGQDWNLTAAGTGCVQAVMSRLSAVPQEVLIAGCGSNSAFAIH